MRSATDARSGLGGLTANAGRTRRHCYGTPHPGLGLARAPASRDRGFRTVPPRRSDGAAERRNDYRIELELGR